MALDEGIASEEGGVPLVNKCFEAEIAEHGHMSSIQQQFQTLKQHFFALRELTIAIITTTLPIEHHTISIDFLHIPNQLLSFSTAFFLT